MLITGSVPEESQEALVLISLAASCFRQASEEGKQAFEKQCVQNIQPQIKRGGEEISLSPLPSMLPLTHKAVGDAGLEQKACAISREKHDHRHPLPNCCGPGMMTQFA